MPESEPGILRGRRHVEFRADQAGVKIRIVVAVQDRSRAPPARIGRARPVTGRVKSYLPVAAVHLPVPHARLEGLGSVGEGERDIAGDQFHIVHVPAGGHVRIAVRSEAEGENDGLAGEFPEIQRRPRPRAAVPDVAGREGLPAAARGLDLDGAGVSWVIAVPVPETEPGMKLRRRHDKGLVSHQPGIGRAGIVAVQHRRGATRAAVRVARTAGGAAHRPDTALDVPAIPELVQLEVLLPHRIGGQSRPRAEQAAGH